MTIREIALIAARHSTRVAYAMRAALMALGTESLGEQACTLYIGAQK